MARRDLARRAIARARRQSVLMGAQGQELEATVAAILDGAFGSLATVRAESSFVVWLDRIAARVLLARSARWPAVSGDDAPTPPDDARDRAAVEQAVRALGALEPERRLALVLTACDAGDEDLAEVLEMAPAQVHARIERARRELERAMGMVPTTLDETLAHGDTSWIDALTERRLERAAIATLERAPSAAPEPTARPRRWAWVALGAGAAAVAALVIAAVLWPAGPKTPGPRLDAVVALASGGATVGGARAHAGRWIGAHAAFEVPAGGRLGLALGDGTLLLLSAGAKGMVETWTIEKARVRLDAGTAVARIAHRRGRAFVLSMLGLEARAEAATIAVSAGPLASVRVLRGTALVGRDQRLEAGRELRAGARASTAIASAQSAADFALAGRRAVAAHGASVRIETTPPGAIVSLDGERIGATPLSFIGRPGAALLSVALDEHAPVVEQVSLRAGERAERRFTLWPLRRAVP